MIKETVLQKKSFFISRQEGILPIDIRLSNYKADKKPFYSYIIANWYEKGLTTSVSIVK